MNTIIKSTATLLFVGLAWLSTPIAYAATVTNVTSTAYKYVNTDSTSASGLFTNSAFTSAISEAFLWSGPSTNIAGEGQNFENNLNAFFNANTALGSSPFNFNTAEKTDSGPYQYPISSAIGGILLKQAQASLLVLFNSPVSELYWNTKFVAQGGAGDTAGTKISHYVLIDSTISEVPIPAALWLFAPALLGLLGLRRKS
tara:strand:- start:575 stop:1174 length:600 start_codon:yes stop_codon:yes gene_type:complete